MRISAALLSVALIAAAGCSSHKTTVETDQGPATVTQSDDNKTTTVETKEGKVTMGAAVDPAKLGAPVYPGAEKSDEGGYSVQGTQGNAAMAAFKTSDDFEKVYQWYKSNMPAGSEKMKMANGGESLATFGVEDSKGETSVMITSKTAGETDILISHKDAK